MVETVGMLMLYVAACLVAGGAVLVLARVPADTAKSETLFLSFAVGFMLTWFVPALLAGVLGLLWKFEMSRWFCVGVDVVLAALLAGLAAHKRGASACPWFGRGQDAVLLATLGLVFAAFLLAFDSHVLWQDSCLIRAGVVPVKNYLTRETPMVFTPPYILERNGFLIWDSGQRLGPTFMLAPFLALFRNPGMRLLHAFCGVAAAGFAYLVALRFLQRRWQAAVAAAVVALNPYVLSIPSPDENILALAPAAGAFFFVLRGGWPMWMAGAMMGLALGTREIFIVSFPALALPMLLRGRWKEVGSLAAGLILACVPWIALHLGMYFGPTGNIYQAFAAKAPVDYQVWGHAFSLRAFLGWPFTEELVRSPYNGFPTLLEFPLLLLRTFGILLAAAGLTGLVRSGGLTLLARLVAVCWTVPFLAVLMVQSGWVEPNKMGLVLDVTPQLGLLVAAGLGGLVDAGRGLVAGPRRWGVGLVLRTWVPWLGLAGLLAWFQVAAAGWEYPLDRRMFQSRDDVDSRFVPAPEYEVIGSEQAHSDLDRRQMASLHLLPDYGLAFPRPDAALLGYRVGQVVAECARPGLNERYTAFKDVALEVVAFPLDMVAGVRPEDLPTPLPKGPMRGGPGWRRGPAQGSEAMGGPGSAESNEAMRGQGPAEPDARSPMLLEKARALGMKVLPLSWLTHRPLDQIEGAADSFSCEAAPAVETVPLEFDFAVVPVTNPRFVAAAGDASGAIALPRGQIVIVRGLASPEKPGLPLNVIAMASKEGAVFVTWVNGRVPFEFLSGRCDVRLVDAVPGAAAVKLLAPADSPLYIRQTSSHQPRSYHAWQGYISGSGVAVSEPCRTSY